MADQLIPRTCARRVPTQPAVLGIALDKPAVLQPPTDALAQLLHQRLQFTRAR